jgi:carbamoyltransferase
MTSILGISAFYHDSAAALVVDGEIVAAAQQERFSRKKHDSSFPVAAVDYCLAEAGLSVDDLDYVGFYDKPLRKFERLQQTYLAYAPAGFSSFRESTPIWLRQKLHIKRELDRGLGKEFEKPYVFTEHHQAHAASAFFPSPFDEAAILTLDGVGEWATASYGVGCRNRIELTHETRFPHSIGLLYSAFTYFTGFRPNSDEFKLMGLAPYGEPRYVDLLLDRLLDLKQDGSFRMDMSYFNYCQGLTMTSSKLDELFGGPPRAADAPITQREMDIAASIQRVVEVILLRSARHVHKETGHSKLCLAGGVALNCVGNGRILREGPFEEIWIQPAADDAGGALGVAQFIWYQLLDNPRETSRKDRQHGSLLGPSYTNEEVVKFLDRIGACYDLVPDEEAYCQRVAELIAGGKVVGWHQGRMEFGPRALGARSILGDARVPEMQSIINRKVKFREGFRPFAPVVLEGHQHHYFQLEKGVESPYMLLVAPVLEGRRTALSEEARAATGLKKLEHSRSEIPAVTHVDYSARVQTVDSERNPRFRALMEAFFAQTGCPVMINTSFNLGWDPIVCSPAEAYQTFMSSDIDVLAIGNCVLEKRAQRADVPAAGGAVADKAFNDLMSSPCCGQDTEVGQKELVCRGCGRAFAIEDDIPRMFYPHDMYDDPDDVTETVKAFYEETPFPNYDEHDTLRSLIERSRRGIYARKLDESIPYNSDVLEVGCGTGQLSNFLGISCRRVVGADLCGNSLLLGERFRKQHSIARVRFVQMNLFRPAMRKEAFDVVICNGVLHHTKDPFGGFQGLVPLVKPGGYMVVGLYNRYGRLMTDARRTFFRLTGGRGRWLDPYLRTSMSGDKHQAWFADQYRHPHESKHTVGEVMRWFDETGLDFVRAIPSPAFGHDALNVESLFRSGPAGSGLSRLITQLRTVVTGNKEGGFFIMIGRKPNSQDPRAAGE